jgi:hypothetical protein
VVWLAPLSERLLNVKISHRLLQTNYCNHRMYGTSTLCPCCRMPDETFAHVLTCPARELLEARIGLLQTYERTLARGLCNANCSDPNYHCGYNLVAGVPQNPQRQCRSHPCIQPIKSSRAGLVGRRFSEDESAKNGGQLIDLSYQMWDRLKSICGWVI